MAVFENFISYRRKESSAEVKSIYDRLLHEGYSTFCDIYSLSSGTFSEDLLEAIECCTNFILVLGPTSLKDCFNEDDWMKKEIEKAISSNKNIVCVFIDDFRFPDVLPKEIDCIRYKNGLRFDVLYFDSFIEKLINSFLITKTERSNSCEDKDFVIINDNLCKYIGDAEIVSIPQNVKTIGAFAFKDKTKIKKINLNEGLEVIEESAFERCLSLAYITLPKSLTRLEKRAFCRCFELSFVQIDNNLRYIGEEAFSFCEKLKHIEFGTYIENIDSSAFNNCSQLATFSIPIENCTYCSTDGVLYNFDKSTIIRCPENYSIDVFEIPSTVRKISKWCFSKCVNLIDINIPRSVIEVEKYAFLDCNNIINLTLSDSIKQLDVSAFDGWNQKQHVSMGKNFHPLIRYKIEEKWADLQKVNKIEDEEKFCIIKTAFESEEEAKSMAKMLLSKHLIVSGQIKRMKSIYIWNKETCYEDEVELNCFTKSYLFDEISKFINSHHSYELCEIVAIPIQEGSTEFCNWISDYLDTNRLLSMTNH
jgi:uncharacterized protein involved in tolerance to divalent cations